MAAPMHVRRLDLGAVRAFARGDVDAYSRRGEDGLDDPKRAPPAAPGAAPAFAPPPTTGALVQPSPSPPYGAPLPLPPPPYYPQQQAIVIIHNHVHLSAPASAEPYAARPYARRKDPGLAVLSSFFLPGGGQFYNGQVAKGLGFIAAAFVSLLLLLVGIGFLTGIATWIWSMVDAHQVAQRVNRGEIVA